MNRTKTVVNVQTNGHGVVSRRGFVGSMAASFGLSGLGWTDLMAASADDLRNRKMSVIVLWMQGGPSQFETFDPKPGHKNGMETKAIDTAVPGIQIAEGWGKTAAMMKDIAVIRSMCVCVVCPCTTVAATTAREVILVAFRLQNPASDKD